MHGRLLKKKEQPLNHYDAVVIGAGLGGMTSANQMAKAGMKVLLLEAHNKLGGLATWFRRKDGEHVFDVSLHGFPYGMVKTCRKYWSKTISDKIEPLKAVRFLNPQFTLTTNFTREDYERHLQNHFNIETEVTKSFFDAVQDMNFYDGAEMTNRQFFDRFFPGREDVVRFLLEPMAYANGSTLEDPAISFAIVFGNFVSKGVYIFKGGTDLMIELMKAELIKNGVDIRLHSKVEQVLFADSEVDPKKMKVKGIMLDGREIQTTVVVSNSSLHHTIFGLAKDAKFEDEYLKNARAVRANSSSCQVYIGLKKDAKLDFIGDLIFTSRAANFNTTDLLSPDVSSQTFSIYYPDTRPDKDSRYAIVSSSNSRYQDWIHLSAQAYDEQKKKLIERALEDLRPIVPGIDDMIDVIEAATPKTVEKFTHHYQASSFGTKWEGLAISRKLPEQILGYYHAGSVGIIMSGWLGAANYGVIVAHEACLYFEKTKPNYEKHPQIQGENNYV